MAGGSGTEPFSPTVRLEDSLLRVTCDFSTHNVIIISRPPKSEVVELLRGCKAYKSRKSLNPPGALPPAGPDGENVIGVDSDAAPTNKDEL